MPGLAGSGRDGEKYRFSLKFFLKSNDFHCPGWPGAAGLEKHIDFIISKSKVLFKKNGFDSPSWPGAVGGALFVYPTEYYSEIPLSILTPPGVPLHCYPFYTGARTGALPCYCTACLLYIAPVLLLAPRGNPADVPLLCRIYVPPPIQWRPRGRCSRLYSGVPGGAALEVAQDVADASALEDVPGQGWR